MSSNDAQRYQLHQCLWRHHQNPSLEFRYIKSSFHKVYIINME